jgi:hypothetical protein
MLKGFHYGEELSSLGIEEFVNKKLSCSKRSRIGRSD